MSMCGNKKSVSFSQSLNRGNIRKAVTISVSRETFSVLSTKGAHRAYIFDQRGHPGSDSTQTSVMTMNTESRN